MEPRDFEKRYDFKLDDFQKRAMEHIYHGNSVLVSAPTGSGKTVIAEYALELARSRGLKSFYTSPLKALSNQKFRDFLACYPSGEVGLLTGDNSINPDAQLVIMTTEVLRNMIYEKSPSLEEIGFVILDEVHYMQDPHRGAVWEEIVILLPPSVKIVALSATVSNARDIAEWMNSLRGDVKVVTSFDRPVKLENFYFVGKALVPLFSNELPKKITEQMKVLSKVPGRDRSRRRFDLRPERMQVVNELKKRDMLPAIYFLFSRQACDDAVGEVVSSGIRLTNARERKEILDFVEEKVSLLEKADLDCLDYLSFRESLSFGVASHHAGIFPLFKETIEELFAKGLLKVVFATETLSLGINMPARSVVIESLVKWTGEIRRPLTPGEYKQLTGRAGRRGIDDVGYAVLLHQRYTSLDQIRGLVKSEPNPVVSSFDVSYNMAVNLLSEKSIMEAQKILNLSFAQFEADRKVVSIEARLQALEIELDREIEASRCSLGGDASRYRELTKSLSGLSRRLSSLSRERRARLSRQAFQTVKPGDVILTEKGGEAFAVIKKEKRSGFESLLVVNCQGRIRKVSSRSHDLPYVIGSVDINKVSSPVKKVRLSVSEDIERLARLAKDGIPKYEQSREEERILESMSHLEGEIGSHPCHKCSHRDRCLEAARKAERLKRRMRAMLTERDSSHDVVSRRLEDVVLILRKFGFMEGEALTRKGQILRRIYNECDLLVSEAVYSGMLSSLKPEEIAACISWFIYEPREGETEFEQIREESVHLEGSLGELLDELVQIEDEIKLAEERRGLDILGSLDIGFSELAFTWAMGAELEEILERFPGRSVGDVVRNMRQIIDLLRQISEISDDQVLLEKLRLAMQALDRGIVGYSSLESIIEHEVEGSRT